MHRKFSKCSKVLLTAEEVDPFKKIGSFVRTICKLGCEMENKTIRDWPMLNSAKFHGNRMAWLKHSASCG